MMTIQFTRLETAYTLKDGKTFATNLSDIEQIVQDIDRIGVFVEEAFQTKQVPITPANTPTLRALAYAAKQEEQLLFVLTPTRCCCLHVCRASKGTVLVHTETDDLPEAVPYTMQE